jgi:glycosyltransferase involved in cell wall biosynthesis
MALRDRLRRLGVPDRSMRHIPWGVLPPSEAADVSADLRPVLGLPRDRPVYLWAGFIQQIREQDFRFAYRTALAALSKGLAASFVFAFKPEVWRSDFADLARPDEGIHTMATDAERFAELKRAADVFYSPVVRRDCIIAPPLTWIEMMALGRPIITTSVQGADELVEHARTGYLAEDESTLIEHLFRIRDDPHAMREACRGAVSKRYNLLDIRDRYLRLWLGADA